jgi:SagB-type dehydrogenase family enzyme
MNRLFLFSLLTFILILPAAGQSGALTLPLPRPDTVGGKPLMQVLKERKTTRMFGERKLSGQTLSNLLWAGFGINRPDGHRTAPSAMNWQEIDIYVATAEGLFLYNATSHSLIRISDEDLRSATGSQEFVSTAPINLIYVADQVKMKRSTESDQLYNGADCGAIAENVYLFCASEGLGCVVRGSVKRDELAKLMHLQPQQRIIFAQSVGYPK